jgi:hypothetical protein
MVAKNKQEMANSSGKKQFWSWLSLLVTAVLLIIGIWYIAQFVTLAELVDALTAANPLFILLSLLSVTLTLVIKTWRWQILLTTPDEKPPFRPLFWAFTLGAYVNLILPFMRMGEIARIFAVDWMTNVGKAHALGTIVVEKLLDLIMMGLMFLLILPFVILPGFMSNPLPMITAVSFASIFILYLLAYQTKWVIRISRLFASWLPANWEERVMRWLISGLESLDALRNKRQTVSLIGLSLLIAFLSVLNGYLLFPAFHLNLGFLEAALLTIVVMLAIVPPSTPGKLGVLNGAVALTLIGLGIRNEAIIVSYSTIYYIIVVSPVILFGGLAVSRTNWKWEKPQSI